MSNLFFVIIGHFVFKFLFYIGVKLISNMLVPAVQQSDSVRHTQVYIFQVFFFFFLRQGEGEGLGICDHLMDILLIG